MNSPIWLCDSYLDRRYWCSTSVLHQNCGFIGKDETTTEKLRSLLAQLEYKYQVNLYHSKWIPFKDHLYVPEVHPITEVAFCKREDEGHIFKVAIIFLKYANYFDLSENWF